MLESPGTLDDPLQLCNSSILNTRAYIDDDNDNDIDAPRASAMYPGKRFKLSEGISIVVAAGDSEVRSMPAAEAASEAASEAAYEAASEDAAEAAADDAAEAYDDLVAIGPEK